MKIKGVMIESPNFILTKELFEKYRMKTDKFLFTNFYMWSKKELNLYPNLKSKDKILIIFIGIKIKILLINKNYFF